MVRETEMEIKMDISSKLHGQITYSLNLEPSFIIYQIGVPNNANKGPSERRGGIHFAVLESYKNMTGFLNMDEVERRRRRDKFHFVL